MYIRKRNFEPGDLCWCCVYGEKNLISKVNKFKQPSEVFYGQMRKLNYRRWEPNQNNFKGCDLYVEGLNDVEFKRIL